jgi:hypothetical protein
VAAARLVAFSMAAFKSPRVAVEATSTVCSFLSCKGRIQTKKEGDEGKLRGEKIPKKRGWERRKRKRSHVNERIETQWDRKDKNKATQMRRRTAVRRASEANGKKWIERNKGKQTETTVTRTIVQHR